MSTRSLAVALLLVLGACGFLPERGDESARPDGPPNIVLLVADDMGWRDLGCTGHPVHETEAIDGLAREGVRFTQAYANAPNCAPSRAALLSGLYAPRTGVFTVGTASRGKTGYRKLLVPTNRTDLDLEFVTLAEALRAGGYRTGHVGKWHLGPDPCTQGFDVNVAGGTAGHPKGYRSPYRNANLPDGPDGEYLTDRLGEEAVRFIEEEDGRPFFLYLPFYSVHTPIQGRSDLHEYYKAMASEGVDVKPGYAAMVTALDEAVGEVLAALEREGLEENTIVVFFSDNGGHGGQTSMAPLRGAKGMLYEGGIREPLICRWPGRWPAGVLRDEPVLGFDLYPTLLAAAGVPVPEGLLLDGFDLGPTLARGAPTGRDALFWHFPAYLEATGRSQSPWRTTPAAAVRLGRWKLLEFFEDGSLELYDVVDDPGETHDLASVHPEVTGELHARLLAWREETGARVPREPNPCALPSAGP